MNNGELMEPTVVEELSGPVLKAEAERLFTPEESPEATDGAPVVATDAATEAAPAFTADMSGYEGVAEAASHAEAIIDSAPVETEAPVELAMPEGFTFPELPEVPAAEEKSEVEEVSRTESHIDELEDYRKHTREEAREQAAEEAAQEYASLREEELELVVEAAHEEWSDEELEDKLGTLKEELAA